jgi:orotate phosphoribosyltransferase
MDFKTVLEDSGGLWQYKAPGKYLASLSSGKLSDTFCNTGVIILTKGVKNWVVIGPGMGGITLAYALAFQSYNIFGEHLQKFAFFTEPDAQIKYRDTVKFIDAHGFEHQGCNEAYIEKTQKFRFTIPNYSTILICEDVITTGGSVLKTLTAINAEVKYSNSKILPMIACLVDRRDEKEDLVFESYDGKFKVVSLLEITARTWETLQEAQKDCHYVIEAIKPKDNWEKLKRGRD